VRTSQPTVSPREQSVADLEAEIRALVPVPTSAREAFARLKASGRGGNRKAIFDAYKRIHE
jgi:hypothetical protein